LLRTRAHDRDWVAWAMAGTGLGPSGRPYDEASARAAGGPSLERGFELMKSFLGST
jgi:2,3-bisphosphoglycerate-independent phosphoglycerate mutase